MSIGFDDGEPILVGDNDPDLEFEAFETQMVSPDLRPRLRRGRASSRTARPAQSVRW